MALAKKAGTAGQLYRNTGSWASPSWSACKVQALKLTNKPGGVFDSSDRTISVNTKIATRSEWVVEFEFIWDASDTNLAALYTAATTNANIELAVTDDAIATSGTKGLRAEWCIESGWDNDLQLQAGQMVKLTASPAGNYTNAPVLIAV
jgi:hypothetical protein